MNRTILPLLVLAALAAAPARAADADATGLVPTIWWDFETKPSASGLATANKGSASISFTSEGTATYQTGVTNGWALDTSKFTPYSGAGSFSTAGNPFTLSLVMTLGTKANGITLNLRTTAGDLIVRRGADAGSLVVGWGAQQAASSQFLNATFVDGDAAFHLVSVVGSSEGTELYVDGELADSSSAFTPWSASGKATQMQFGSHLNSVKAGEAKNGGLIDDLRIHDAALTPAQIKAIGRDVGLLTDPDFIAVAATGVDTVWKDSFSTSWNLGVAEGRSAEAGLVYGTDAALSTPTTNALGTALPAGTYTASLAGLDPGTTYWWKIVASNGVNWAETPVASFRTRDVVAARSFTKRIPVTVSGYAGTETLADFPVLVRLAAGEPAGFDYGDCATDGSDLRFAAADGTMLSHEVESWNPNGMSYVWVKVPALAGTATAFDLLYGANPATLPAVDPTDVWTRYAVVIHGGDALANAVGNGLAVAAGSASVAANPAAGKAGGGIRKSAYNAVGVNVDEPTPKLSDAGRFSVSGWFNRDGNGGKDNNGTHILMGNRKTWNANGEGFVVLAETGTRLSVSYKGGHTWTTGTNLTSAGFAAGAWGHVAFSYDRSGARLVSYLNGIQDNESDSPNSLVNSDSTLAYWTFGSLGNNSTDDCFRGDMDELRVFNGFASGDWIRAEHDTVAAPAAFAALGAAELTNPDAPRIGAASAAVSRSDATFSVSLVNLSATATVSVFYGPDLSTLTELPLGSLAADGTLSGTAAGLDIGTYVWYARATTALDGAPYATKSGRSSFDVTFAKEPTASYKHFTATISYAGTAAAGVPVPLRLSEAGIDGFHYADVTESGFEFVDESGNLLPWELDTWDTNGVSVVWVKVPSYAEGATIEARYGATFANARPAATQVWGGYAGVWHLGDTNSASAYGSYPNSTATAGIDGEKAEASVADEEGVLGRSVMISPATAKQGEGYQLGGVFVPDSGAGSPLDLGDTFAISGWFKHKDFDYYWDKLFGKRKKANNEGSPNGSFAIEIANNGSDNNVTALGSGTATTKLNFRTTLRNVWSHLVFVYDGTSCRIYQDGALVGTSTIIAVADNNAPLCFGNLTGGYGDGTGDCAWAGWIDEVRLADGVPSADYLAAEYHAMANAVAIGAVVSVDMGDPRISAPVVERRQDGSFLVTAEISENEPMAGSVACVVGETSFPMTTSDTALPATYSAIVSGISAGTYVATVQAQAAGGTVVSRAAATPFHAGALVVTGVADADEASLSPGTFRIARADADPAGLPAISFDLAFSGPGLAAIVAPTVATLTIPAGEASVDVSVTPVYTTAVDADAILALAVSGAFVGTPSSGSIMIVNAAYDPTVRYVATTGDDANHGGTPESPKKTIGAAVDSLASISQTLPCTVHVAPGLYPISAPIALNQPIWVLGDDSDPSRTIVSNKSGAGYLSGNQRVFTLNHADAFVANLTMQKGSSWGGGGSSFYIQSNGGMVSNCVVEAGQTAGNGASCGGGLLDAGRVTHTVFRKCTVGSGESSDGNQAYRPAVLWLKGTASAENCLLVDNTQNKSKALSLVRLDASSVMRNCTIVDSGLGTTNSYCAVFAPLYIGSQTATAQNVVVVGVTNLIDGARCGPAGKVSRFLNGAVDVESLGFPVGTVSGSAAAFFPHYAENVPYAVKYRPKSGGPLYDKGADYAPMAAFDLSGVRPRRIGSHVDIGCYEGNAARTMLLIK